MMVQVEMQQSQSPPPPFANGGSVGYDAVRSGGRKASRSSNASSGSGRHRRRNRPSDADSKEPESMPQVKKTTMGRAHTKGGGRGKHTCFVIPFSETRRRFLFFSPIIDGFGAAAVAQCHLWKHQGERKERVGSGSGYFSHPSSLVF